MECLTLDLLDRAGLLAVALVAGINATQSSVRANELAADVDGGFRVRLRLAQHNSQPGAEVIEHAPVPRWGWGEAPPFKPRYRPGLGLTLTEIFKGKELIAVGSKTRDYSPEACSLAFPA